MPVRLGGGIGRHAGLKIPWTAMSVRVRFPSEAHNPSWKKFREGFLFYGPSRVIHAHKKCDYVRESTQITSNAHKSALFVRTIRKIILNEHENYEFVREFKGDSLYLVP